MVFTFLSHGRHVLVEVVEGVPLGRREEGRVPGRPRRNRFSNRVCEGCSVRVVWSTGLLESQEDRGGEVRIRSSTETPFSRLSGDTKSVTGPRLKIKTV